MQSIKYYKYVISGKNIYLPIKIKDENKDIKFIEYFFDCFTKMSYGEQNYLSELYKKVNNKNFIDEFSIIYNSVDNPDKLKITYIKENYENQLINKEKCIIM